MYGGAFAMIGALLEANALRSGAPDARHDSMERYARVVDTTPPLAAGASWRARAYAADAAGQPHVALALLERAEHVATRYGRRLDAAIAKWQRGRRIGGDAGAASCREAEAIVTDAGATHALLAEDVALR